MEIIRQLENAFHIHDEEVSMLTLTSMQDETAQVDTENKPACSTPDHSTDSVKNDASKVGIGHEKGIPRPDSPTLPRDNPFTLSFLKEDDENGDETSSFETVKGGSNNKCHSSEDDEEDEETSSIEPVKIPNTDGGNDTPPKSCLKQSKRPEPVIIRDFALQAEKNLNINVTKTAVEEVNAPEGKKSSFWKKGKQPAKSCIVDRERKTPSSNETKSTPSAKRQGPRVKFKIPESMEPSYQLRILGIGETHC